ncbi:MAG: Valine--tRNA ligase [Candidatus Omnitrophica bacterium]|nr:Valine--tRNA ligase [Candidatus Omnitrophota bacterium]
MSSPELSKVYEPKSVEKHWYAHWLKKGYFKAKAAPKGKPYTIVIPPPNVTGILHMGHALNNTLQDILIRYKRMSGYRTLWMPGTDHAGIATQNVVERSLREEGLTRQQLGREAFLERVWKWREKYGNTIVRQLHRLGASCDWDRTRFTMDEGLSEAVREVFVRLYEKGLIYRGKYIINWCPRCQTALSDEEVQHKEINGHLYHLKYAIEGTDGHVTIATTRPETMLGDTAVGFNPTDERYRHLSGRTATLPLINRRLRIISDESIDPSFGTGALKITPSHDPVDFELARKHELEFINILNPDGTLNENAGPYAGLDRFEARRRIVADLEDRRILLEIKEHQHSVGHCYRCSTVIEPYFSSQWFVHMKPLAAPAIEAVEKERTVFAPKRWTKVYLDWMHNIKDWCVSRQIWWGHRIPVWTCAACRDKGKTAAETVFRPGQGRVYREPGMIVARKDPKACPDCGGVLEQDPDVLDTWFSSWLWPFSTLGWPEKNKDLKFFYPTACLVTGYEIIFFWVARMIMSGIEFMGREPFKQVYIHGIVRDETGAKMSKSLGNAVDPIEIIDEFGADALRYGIISITAEGQDVYCSKEKFEVGRNFANKIWNASRLVLMNLDTRKLRPSAVPTPAQLGPINRWIISRVNQTAASLAESLDRHRFNEAASTLYDFIWHQYCDWYLELAKPTMKDRATQWTMHYVLERTLRLLHPFMPFITEEIWQKIPHKGESIMVSEWPKPEKRRIDPKLETEVDIILGEIQAIRNVRSAWQINPKESVTVAVKVAGDTELRILREYSTYIVQMAKVSSLQIGKTLARPKESAVANVGRVETYVVLTGLVDVQVERQRIEAALADVDRLIRGLEGRLKNEEFLRKAPKEIVDKERQKAVELESRRQRLHENLRSLGE